MGWFGGTIIFGLTPIYYNFCWKTGPKSAPVDIGESTIIYRVFYIGG